MRTRISLLSLALVLISGFAHGEIILLGSKSMKGALNKQNIAKMERLEFKNEKYEAGYAEGPIDISAEASFNDKGELVIQQLEVKATPGGLTGKLVTRVVIDVPFSKEKIDKVLKTEEYGISNPVIRMRLMKPLTIVVGDKAEEAIKSALLPSGDVKKLDSLFEYKAFGDYGVAGGGVHDLVLGERTKLADHILPHAFKLLAALADTNNFAGAGVEFAPEHLANRKDLKVQEKKVGDQNVYYLGSGKDVEIPADLAKNVGEYGAIAVTPNDIAALAKSFLDSRKEKLPKGYTRGDKDGVFVYTATVDEEKMLNGKSIAWDIEHTTASFRIEKNTMGEAQQYLVLQLATVLADGTERKLSATYRINSANAFEIQSVDDGLGEKLAGDVTKSKFFARDIRNILINALMSKPLIESIGKPEAKFQIQLVGLTAQQADSFGEEVESASHLVIKR